MAQHPNKQTTIATTNNNRNNNNTMTEDTTEQTESLQFYPFEINGQKYLMCKLPNEPFSTLHDPDTKQMVGQWNNDTAQYVLYPLGNLRVIDPALHSAAVGNRNTDTDIASLAQTTNMTEQQFEQHMRQLIASGNAFTIGE